MTNIELIKRFSKGYTSGGSGGKAFNNKYNLRIEGDNLVNYSTIIAKRGLNGEIVLNKKKYSRTTSKIQSYIRNYCNVSREVEGI